MKAIIEQGNISGSVIAPPSKSMTQRAYAAALLHRGTTIIRHAGWSDDEQAALRVIQQLGATVVRDGAIVKITSAGVQPVSDHIHCGESGLSARLFTPIAALSDKAIKIEGAGSLLRRPMDGMEETLTALQAGLTRFNGYVPFIVHGPLRASSIAMDAGNSSQFLSGLLFALCDCATVPVTIEVTGLKSKPYIDMTLAVLALFGRPVAHNNYEQFYIDPALFTEQETVETDIEADWSSAAYMLVAGAIAGEITVSNLNADSRQADRAIVEVLNNAGANVVIGDDCISVKKARLWAFEFDATDCPDLFPVLSVLAACCEGESYITGVHRLFDKESNRAESITEMLQDFNVLFSIEDDVLCITGVRYLQGTVIDSYKDHRIVMAAAIGALRANGPVEISDAGAVNKSYPGFFDDLVLCGGRCILE